MAAKFKSPRDSMPLDDGREVPAGSPPVVPPCEYLREIKSGTIFAYSERLASRGDLVEAYHGPIPTPEQEIEARMLARGIKPKAAPKALSKAKAKVPDLLGEPLNTADTHEAQSAAA